MAKKKQPKVTVSYAQCSLTVQGMNMKCPLCGVLVKSGEQHACKRPEINSEVQR